MTQSLYYERLFVGKGLRSYLHNARFHWLNRQLKKSYERQQTISVLDFGCHDAIGLQLLASPPGLYVGVDYAHEAIALARARYGDLPNARFECCQTPAQFSAMSFPVFDVVMALETLEHLHPDELEPYLELLSNRCCGHAYFTVPNEQGLSFAAKYVFQKLFHPAEQIEPYTLKEYFSASCGQMNRVPRIVGGHKGFSWRHCVKSIEKFFSIIATHRLPINLPPGSPAFGIAIQAKPKTRLIENHNV